jgi:uncharacterized protein (DUF488 family)
MPEASQVTVYTIGHGRHPWADFLALLRQHEIELLCDVRSVARSRWVQFNGQVLEAALGRERIGYEWIPECGGKKIAPPAELARGLDRIIELASDARACIMCSESQPLTKHKQPRANCHRVGLLSTPLRERGARVIHILPDGSTLEIDESLLPSIW